MAPDDNDSGTGYRTARIVSAGILIAAAVLVSVLGAFDGFRTPDVLIVTAMLATAAGLLGLNVNLDFFRRG